MNQQLKFSNEARNSILEGVNIVADAVAATLGPRGRIVAIDNDYGVVTTKDGITVAHSIESDNIGAKLIKEVSKRTNDVAGDGTTTATVLTQAIVNQGIKKLSDGADAQSIKRGLEKTLDTITEALNSLSKPVTDVEAIASISANDPEIGKLIGDTVKKLGDKSVIVVEQNQVSTTEAQIIEGIQIDSGWQSMYMVTDRSTMKAEYENSPILIVDGKPTIHQLLPLLESLLQEQPSDRQLIIMSEQLDEPTLATLVQNTLKGTLKVLAIKSPGFGENKTNSLLDLALLTGATVLGGINPIDKADISCLGKVDRIVSDNSTSTIISKHGDQKAIKEHVESLENTLSKTTKPFEKERLSSRISKLTSGIGVIKVGASTEPDAREKKHRVEDAVNATYAAISEGVVEGGGITLLRLQKFIQMPLEDAEEDIGRQIIHKALEAPFRKIVENAGKNAELVLSGLTDKNGYNAKTLEHVEDMHKAGVIDPKKVTRLALESSVSIAKTVLTTEVTITKEPLPSPTENPTK